MMHAFSLRANVNQHKSASVKSTTRQTEKKIRHTHISFYNGYKSEGLQNSMFHYSQARPR